MEVWYRMEGVQHAPLIDDFGNAVGPSRIDVVIHQYEVSHHTPCGVRLESGKVVLHRHKKKFACATVEEAKQCFLAKKNRQIKILSTKVNAAKQMIEIANRKWNTEIEIPYPEPCKLCIECDGSCH